jgi:hypothetical protein
MVSSHQAALTAPSSPLEAAAGSVAIASARGSRVSSPVMDGGRQSSCMTGALERPSFAVAGSGGGFGSFAGFGAPKSSEIMANGLPLGAVNYAGGCYETRVGGGSVMLVGG